MQPSPSMSASWDDWINGKQMSKWRGGGWRWYVGLGLLGLTQILSDHIQSGEQSSQYWFFSIFVTFDLFLPDPKVPPLCFDFLLQSLTLKFDKCGLTSTRASHSSSDIFSPRFIITWRNSILLMNPFPSCKSMNIRVSQKKTKVWKLVCHWFS